MLLSFRNFEQFDFDAFAAITLYYDARFHMLKKTPLLRNVSVESRTFVPACIGQWIETIS